MNSLDNLFKLGLSVKVISTLSNIPQDRIYKWKQKLAAPKAEDSKKLEELLQKMKPEPTNDFVENIVAEPGADYGKSKDDEIVFFKGIIADLKADKQRLIVENDVLKEKLRQAEEKIESAKPPEQIRSKSEKSKNSGARRTA